MTDNEPRVTRFSGQVVVTIQLTSDDRYSCKVLSSNEQCIMTLDPPSVLSHALDSSEAYDEVARSSIAFAIAEYEELGRVGAFQGCAMTEHGGYYVARTLDEAWPQEDGR